MQVRRFFVFSRLALLWAGACVHAQTTLTIDDAVRTALQNHPLLQERQQRSEVASGFALETIAGDAVRRWVERGLATDDGRRVRLTREGLLVSDALWADVLRTA